MWNLDLFALYNEVRNEVSSHLKQTFPSMFDLLVKGYFSFLNTSKYPLLTIMI